MRELAAGRQELERTEREAERRARELEVRDRLLHHAGEEIRDARSQARAIQRSRAWRLARVLSRGAALARRDGGALEARLERLTRLSPADQSTVAPAPPEPREAADGDRPDSRAEP